MRRIPPGMGYNPPMAEKTEAAPKKGPVVVSVINLKGGVGKTTAAVLLARYAAQQNLNVLAVDLDPQANMSQALMEGDYTKFMDAHQPSVLELFGGLGYIPPSPERTAPAPLAQIARKVKGRDNFHAILSRFDFSDALIASVKFDERALARFIAQEMQDRDLILIDCAPTDSALSRAAYHASRYVLIPVREDFFSTIGFPLLWASLEKFRKENPGHGIEVCGVLTTIGDYDPGPDAVRARKDIKKDAQKHKWPVMNTVLRYSKSIPRMMRVAHPPNVHSPTWNNIASVAEEFLQKVGMSTGKNK